jgi:isoquinoline 1-oxidoreductase subunit alpha
MRRCGACTVYLGGEPVRSCSLPASGVGDSEITTMEGLKGREVDAVKGAWIAHDMPQCGYCQSGQVMSATALLQLPMQWRG